MPPTSFASATSTSRHLAIELEKPGAARKGLMPGVRELLDALAPRETTSTSRC